jgi:hypothetical protein
MSLKDLKTTGINKDSNREFIEMQNDPNRHRFLGLVDLNDVRLRTERQFLPYEEDFKKPNKQQYNGAGYNMRFTEGHAELVGNDPKFWNYKESGDGMQNTNLLVVKDRRK